MSTQCFHNGTVFTGVTVLPESTVIVQDGKISDVISNEQFGKLNLPSDTRVYDVRGAHVAPGFIDTHIHGLHGFDTADGSVDSILEMSKALVEYGVTGFCPTMYPQEDGQFRKSIQAAVEAMGQEEGAKVFGLHLEGPFVSTEKPGVLNPEYMKNVDLDLMQEYYDLAQGHITIMTVAPELEGMHELALYGTKKGIVLSAGHSNATYEHMLDGMQGGILHSTHFFNAMRRLHHRDPGVVGAIMIHPNVSCEIIGDGLHVHPALVKLLMRVKPIHKIILVTDALRPTEQKHGKMIANNEEVYVEDGVFKRKADGTIAGSSLTMIRGVKTLAGMGVPLDDAMRMAACNPATVMSRQIETGYIIPGKDADVVVFDSEFKIKATMVKGSIKKLEL
jgi:N-acetylglucosamine-6-phosphate deacetylase